MPTDLSRVWTPRRRQPKPCPECARLRAAILAYLDATDRQHPDAARRQLREAVEINP